MPRPSPALFPTCLALWSILVLFNGCATNPVSAGGRAMIGVPKAAFYKYGPAQTFGPDFLLNQGAIVTVLKQDFGFTRVMTDDGTAGYVSSDDLRPAPAPPSPEPPSSSGSSRVSSFSSGKPKRSNLTPTSGSPLFEAGDLSPLPDNSEPPKPSPSFRF